MDKADTATGKFPYRNSKDWRASAEYRTTYAKALAQSAAELGQPGGLVDTPGVLLVLAVFMVVAALLAHHLYESPATASDVQAIGLTVPKAVRGQFATCVLDHEHKDGAGWVKSADVVGCAQSVVHAMPQIGTTSPAINGALRQLRGSPAPSVRSAP